MKLFINDWSPFYLNPVHLNVFLVINALGYFIYKTQFIQKEHHGDFRINIA